MKILISILAFSIGTVAFAGSTVDSHSEKWKKIDSCIRETLLSKKLSRPAKSADPESWNTYRTARHAAKEQCKAKLKAPSN